MGYFKLEYAISEQRNTQLDNEYLWEKDKLAIYNEEMGIYYRGKGDLETAKDKYIKGLKYAPHSERLILSLSNIYQKENNPDQAEKLIDSSIKNGNTGRKMMIELGVIEMKKGEYNKAIQVFKNIMGTNQDDMEVLGNIASCYYSLKDYRTSMDYSNMVIKLNPSFPLPYIGIGDCYLLSGDTLKAKENYIRANELDKEHEYKEMIDNRLNSIRQ